MGSKTVGTGGRGAITFPNLSGVEAKCSVFTLDSGIDVGQKKIVEPEKFGKKNKCRALNKRRAWKIWQVFVMEKPENIFIFYFSY